MTLTSMPYRCFYLYTEQTSRYPHVTLEEKALFFRLSTKRSRLRRGIELLESYNLANYIRFGRIAGSHRKRPKSVIVAVVTNSNLYGDFVTIDHGPFGTPRRHSKVYALNKKNLEHFLLMRKLGV